MRLIDADKLKEVLKVDGKYQWVGGIGTIREVIDNQPTVNATPIPDNATNGDVWRTLYPNAKIEITDTGVYVMDEANDIYASFDEDWWYAPYKKGGTE